MAKPVIKVPPKCYVCGDKGHVPRIYRDKEIGLGDDAWQLVPCPKCQYANPHPIKKENG